MDFDPTNADHMTPGEAAVKRCPHCDAIRLAFGREHCENPGCDWLTCIYCKATYHQEQPIGFLNQGDITWHSSTEAGT